MIKNELTKRILSSLILIPIVFFVVSEGSFLFNFFILICFLITSYEWHMMSRKKLYNFLGFLFLFCSFYSAYKIRINMIDGYEYFLIILLICISTDIGGYIFGKFFKGPKLTKISPKKTYSGVIGGYLFSILFITLFFNYADLISEITNIDIMSKELFLNNFILTIIISTVSQFGDIVVSYFKRKSKIKDTGKIIPGHGGLLDRIDGMIFAFPITLLIFKIFY